MTCNAISTTRTSRSSVTWRCVWWAIYARKLWESRTCRSTWSGSTLSASRWSSTGIRNSYSRGPNSRFKTWSTITIRTGLEFWRPTGQSSLKTPKSFMCLKTKYWPTVFRSTINSPPPSYSEVNSELPPNYEDVVKEEKMVNNIPL